MPVPIAVTHPQGRGLLAAVPSTVNTDGPFARAAKAREANADAAASTSTSTAAPGDHANSIDDGAAAGTASGEPSASAPASLPEPEGESTIVVNSLDFSYPGLDGRPIPGQPPLITSLNLSLPRGARCLLLGANGAGKTTLLKILGGKHLVPPDAVRVLGHSPFHDTALTSSGRLAYVGGNWTRDIAFAGNSIPLTGDFPAQRMLDAVPGANRERMARLVKVLDIDPQWRMHQVSDGQRRRVQLAVGLMRPFEVLLLDEITVDLDVLGRAELMRFLAAECEQRGSTVMYATHIFDGLEAWPTHVAYVARGRLQLFKRAEAIPELREGRLLEFVARLLREEREALRRSGAPPKPLEYDPSKEGDVGAFSYAFNNGWVPGTMVSSLKGSTNAVMRS